MTSLISKLAAEHVSALIQSTLSRDLSVLWLISGGSAIAVAVEARRLLGDVPKPGQLHIGLVDERFGPTGHEDSNLQQLITAGFDIKDTTVHSVLKDGLSAQECTDEYAMTLQELLRSVDKSVGLFGIGADAHTAGILPGSPALDVGDTLVSTYEGPDFVRITTTPALISKLDEAVLYAVGENKWPAVQQFLTDGPTDTVPARIIKSAKSYKLYTDYKGETI